jgi:ubiquinone/menaquinone biosynthesis C-methylase UbiE
MGTEQREAINIRYSDLAETSCCLSCGGAVDRSGAAEGEICVDLGSGRGRDVIRLAEIVGPRGFVYGIDLSDGMIAKARRNAEKFGVTNVSFHQSLLEELPLEDAKADLVISNCTINHAEDKGKVWKEVARVLKPGGRFVVSDIYSLSEVPEKYRRDPKAVAECWAGAVTRELYIQQLEKAGFTEVSILEESEPYEKGEIEVASWTIRGEKPVSAGHSK